MMGVGCGSDLIGLSSIVVFVHQDPEKYRFGKTKIFFRAGQVSGLVYCSLHCSVEDSFELICLILM